MVEELPDRRRGRVFAYREYMALINAGPDIDRAMAREPEKKAVKHLPLRS